MLAKILADMGRYKLALKEQEKALPSEDPSNCIRQKTVLEKKQLVI